MCDRPPWWFEMVESAGYDPACELRSWTLIIWVGAGSGKGMSLFVLIFNSNQKNLYIYNSVIQIRQPLQDMAKGNNLEKPEAI
jgi:hypothetical protein